MNIELKLFISMAIAVVGILSNYANFVAFFTGKRNASQLNVKDIISSIIIVVAIVFLAYNTIAIIEPDIIDPPPPPTPPPTHTTTPSVPPVPSDNLAKYEMEVYVTQEAYEPYRRNFRDYSVQGTNEVYSTRDTYGEKHITFTVTEDQLAQAAVYSPGATIPEDNSGMFVGGINKSNKEAYVMQIPLYDGRYYPLFIKAKIG